MVYKNNIYRHKALSTRVLIVASVNPEVGDWAAYIDAVPGKNHFEEWQAVAENGTKTDIAMAFYYFPDFAEKYRWRV